MQKNLIIILCLIAGLANAQTSQADAPSYRIIGKTGYPILDSSGAPSSTQKMKKWTFCTYPYPMASMAPFPNHSSFPC